MSKGNRDPDSNSKQHLAVQMQTMAWNQLTCFFTAPAAPESLEEFWLVQISSWSISKKHAGAAVSCHLQRVLPWPHLWSQFSWCWCSYASPLDRLWLMFLGRPQVFWVPDTYNCGQLFCGTQVGWKKSSIFFPFSHISGKRAFSHAWETIFAHSALIDCGGFILIYEVDAYGYISVFLAKQM